jgi:hypothetical protein
VPLVSFCFAIAHFASTGSGDVRSFASGDCTVLILVFVGSKQDAVDGGPFQPFARIVGGGVVDNLDHTANVSFAGLGMMELDQLSYMRNPGNEVKIADWFVSRFPFARDADSRHLFALI